jgi:hypothetical protein
MLTRRADTQRAQDDAYEQARGLTLSIGCNTGAGGWVRGRAGWWLRLLLG